MNVEECEAKTEHMWQFAHVGRIASDASSYLLRGTFPLREIDEQKDAVKRLRQSLRLVYDDLPNGETKDLLHQNMELIDAVMRSTNNKLSDIYSILDNGAHAIMKRSIVVAAGLAALVNLGLGQLAHLFISQQLSGEQRRLSMATRMAAGQIEDNRNHIAQVNETIFKLSRFVYKAIGKTYQVQEDQRNSLLATLLVDSSYRSIQGMEDSIDSILRIFDDSISGKVTTRMFPPRNVKGILKTIREVLPPGMQLAIDISNPWEFYNLHSYPVIHDGELMVFLSIPIYDRTSTMELYRYRPIPLLVDSDKDIDLLLSPDKEYLATDDARTVHQSYEEKDLNGCAQLGNLKLCPQLRVYRKASNPSCLFAMITNQIKLAQRLCEAILIRSPPLVITQISTNEFMVHAREDTTLTELCTTGGNGESVSRAHHILKGSNIISLRDGCSLTSEGLYVYSGRNSTIAIDDYLVDIALKNFTWHDFILTQRPMGNGLEPEEALKIADELLEETPSVSISALLAGSPSDDDGVSMVWTLTASLVSLTIVLGIIGLVLLLYVKHRCRRCRREQVSLKGEDPVEEEMIEIGN